MAYNILQEDLWSARKHIASLIEEVDHKNQRLLEMEHNNNETAATMHELVTRLIEEISNKDQILLEMEQKYKEASADADRFLKKQDRLREIYYEGTLCFVTNYYTKTQHKYERPFV